jgi:serine/threonine protein kinase/Tol biopolymer transport system component
MSKADRAARLEALYHAAREKPSSDRAAFLDEACAGDTDLRREVESLLAQPGTGDGLLDTPALAAADGLLSLANAPQMIGRRIGVYQVQELIGAGGMGEVYRARDTRLGRDVAIKILPHVFSTDSERTARFEREARLLAALNHPHIGAIHGLEESDGVRALVLELVEGETLAERIARGPVPITEALQIARQIAEALDAAHEKGIVHRDLKPANIKITPDGLVKVLDFGLARASAGDGSGPDLTKSPTITVGATDKAVILGTAAYMSPEQARGKPVDKRTDIWAFGCVLFEMLTGKPAFPGDTVSDTIAAILEREPDWSALPAATPTPIRRLLERCFEKDPRRRQRDIGDAEPYLQESTAIVPTLVTRPRAGARNKWAFAAMATAAVLAAYVLGRRSIDPVALNELSSRPTMAPASMALSPDGTQLASVGIGNDGVPRIWIQWVKTGEAHEIKGTERGMYPFWSPDSRHLAFSAANQLKRVEVATTAPPCVIVPSLARGGTWSVDDTIVFDGGYGSQLLRVSADCGGNKIEPVRPKVRADDYVSPQFLPDERHFLFLTIERDLAPGTGNLYVADIELTDPPRQLLTEVQAATYASNHLLIVRQNRLFAQPFNGAYREPPTAKLAEIDHSVIVSEVGHAALSTSVDGPIAYRTGAAGTEFAWISRDGTRLKSAVEDIGDAFNHALTPDNRHLMVSDRLTGNLDLWEVDLMDREKRFVTDHPSVDLTPVYSPTNLSLFAFGSDRVDRGRFLLYVGSTTNRREVKPIVVDKLSVPNDWHGDTILYAQAGQGRDLWFVSVSTLKTEAFVELPNTQTHGQFSPDGTCVAYQSDETGPGNWRIYVQGRAKGDRANFIADGVQPRWNPTKDELFFLTADNSLMSVSASCVREPAKPQLEAVLYPRGEPLAGNQRHYSVRKDGQAFLVDTNKEVNPTTTVRRDWKPGAREGRAGE